MRGDSPTAGRRLGRRPAETEVSREALRTALRLWIVAVLTAFLLPGTPPAVATAPPPPHAPAVPEVAPGRSAVWEGRSVTLCGLGAESWEPVPGEDGTTDCWYPFDLDAEPGVRRVWRVREGAEEEAPLRVGEYAYPVQRLTIEDESKVTLSAEDLERVRRERERIDAVFARRTPRRFTLPLDPPLARMSGGSRFGARRIFNDQPRSPHSGADYRAATGTPVRAVAPGEVVLTGDLFFSGKSVFVDHGAGLVSMYFHLSEVAVAEGEEVSTGQLLGRAGSTGRSTGPHLHLGLRWRGARVDPRLLLDPGEAPRVGEGE